MWIIGYLIIYAIYLLAAFTKTVTARYCEGGHKCLPPKECCAQGCCYLYAPPSAPRSPPPATDHVLNLFFINHWYFWCFLFAIVLALLLCCSLWKKRRQLCGWGSPGHHSQSEMDSAGSCYAPPQYSRCSSFHHAPPPYAEVTSKPDLYPLVFSYTNDGSKNGSGANYLMVQYFRNYIVRPIGSLSGTSTVDSLSSSFICTANEANTLIPPPYSSAASPEDLPMSLHNYAIPRSASQQGYMNEVVQMSELIENQRNNGVNISSSSSHHHHNQQHHPLSGPGAFTRPSSVPNTTNYNLTSMNANMHQFRASESANFTHLFKTNNNNIENCSSANNSNSNIRNNCILIHQIPMSSTSTITTSSRSNPIGNNSHNNNNNNNNSNTSDDEFNNSCGTGSGISGSGNRPHAFNDIQSTSNSFNDTRNNFKNIDGTQQFFNSTNQPQFSQQLQQNKCTIDNFSNNNNNNNNTISNFMVDDNNTTSSSIYHSNDTMSSLSQAMAPPLDRKKGCNNEKLTLIQMQLEKCCQMIQMQQQQQEHLKRTLKTTTPCSNFDSASASPISMEIAKKIGESELMSYMNSNTGSTVSSLANLDSPGSPPQATSPTQEVKDLLEQIRQLKASNYESNESLHEVNLGKFPSEESIDQEPIMEVPVHEPSNIRRPTTLNNKRKFFNMKNKAVYLPISNNTFNSNNCNNSNNSSSNMKLLRSPMSHTGMGILSKGRSSRGRTGWISKSAPTTPGTGLPVNNFMSDDSPLLLNEQDEDDNEHN